MKSEDNGDSWTVKLRPTDRNDGRFVDIQFLTEDVGYTISSGSSFRSTSILWRTSDGGETWERFTGFPRLEAMAFANDLDGLMVGDGGIVFSTEDGGASWSRDTLMIPANLHDVTFCWRDDGDHSRRRGHLPV